MNEGEKAPKDFKKKREEFTVGLRKTKREEIFSLRRNLPNNEQQNFEEEQLAHREKKYFIDPRFAEYIEKFYKNTYTLNILPELAESLYSHDIVQQHYGIIGIRKIMSVVDQPPIQAIIDAGVLSKLIEFVNQQQYPQLQLEATWALTNIASGNTEQCEAIVEKGVIPLFIKLLKSKYSGIIEQAVWAIGNIASDSSFNRDSILRIGGIPNLIYALHYSEDVYLKEHTAWTLSNLCRGKPLPNFEVIKQGIMALTKLIMEEEIKDESIFVDCSWAIAYNINEDPERTSFMFTSGFYKKAVQLLKQQNNNITIPIARILGHLTSSNHSDTQLIIDEPDFWDSIYRLLCADRKVVRSEICWILSNIAAGNSTQVQEILKREELVTQMLKLFQQDSIEIRRELCHCFANLVIEGDQEQVFSFYQQVNIVKYYANCMMDSNARIIRQSLANLYSILQLGENFKINSKKNPFALALENYGVLPLLEQLQMHKDYRVYSVAIIIIKEFFQVEESVDL